MTFEEVWSQVRGLPEQAVRQVPETISSDTKRRLSKLAPDKVSVIIKGAIDEINHGSVERLDNLIRNKT